MTTASGHTLDGFVKNVLVEGLHRMTYEAGLGYLAVGNIAICIEFLGACIDHHEFAVERQSKARFKLGVDQFMSNVNPGYGKYNDPLSAYYLYKQLRCGMAHLVRPQGKVAFTGRGEALEAGLKHLTVYTPQDKLVIVVEEFFDDFAVACDDLRRRLPGLPHHKLKGVFLPVWDAERGPAKPAPHPRTS
jgi:hypothetical protein